MATVVVLFLLQISFSRFPRQIHICSFNRLFWPLQAEEPKPTSPNNETEIACQNSPVTSLESSSCNDNKEPRSAHQLGPQSADSTIVMISDGEDAEVDDDLVGVDSRDNNDQEDEPEIDEEHFSINHVEVIFFYRVLIVPYIHWHPFGAFQRGVSSSFDRVYETPTCIGTNQC